MRLLFSTWHYFAKKQPIFWKIRWTTFRRLRVKPYIKRRMMKFKGFKKFPHNKSIFLVRKVQEALNAFKILTKFIALINSESRRVLTDMSLFQSAVY